MPAQTVIKFRRDTAANWTTANPVLAAGEAGLETDSGLVKYGNGTSAWADLQYTTAASIKTKVQNNSGSSIAKGSVVYISGANGDNPLIALADADSEATSSKTIGIVEATIANGAQGYVIESGLLTGLNTASATAGQSVWLSSTAGGVVYGAPPAKPAHSVYLGVVTRSNTNNGTILVKVQNGYELNELHDVNAGSPTTGDVLQWNGTAWVNAELDALPVQTGQAGKYLTTDGTDASWATIDLSSVATLTGTETLENKTLEYPTVIGASGYSYTQGATVMNQGADFGGTVYDAHSAQTGYLSVEAYGEINFQSYISAGDVVYLVPTSGTPTLVQVYTAEAGFAMFDIISPSFNVGDTVTGGSFASIAAATATPTGSVTITSLELGYLNGATSNLQTQINTLASAPAGEAISSFMLMGA